MFDVSWVDPTRETVGQRKYRKERSTSVSRRSSIHSSKSTDTAPCKAKPSLLNLFGGVKTPSLTRTGSHPKLSALRVQDETKASRRISSYTVASKNSTQEFSGTTTAAHFPTNGFFTGRRYPSDEHSTPSEGMLAPSATYQSHIFAVSESVFSRRTRRSRKTESTWSSVESTTSSRIIQPLSPTSFVTILLLVVDSIELQVDSVFLDRLVRLENTDSDTANM